MAKKLLWRLAATKCALYSFATLWTCWGTATNNVDLTKLGSWDWFQTIGGCVAAWCLTMSAFVDRSAAQLASGKLPGLENGAQIPDGDTTITRKTDTVVVQQTTTTPST